MEANDLPYTIDYLSGSGIILSPEQKAALQSSLCILQHHQKCSKVYFWGKIFGLKEDYFIAQCVGKDEFGDKKTLYSKDCIKWALLPPATEEIKAKAKLVKGRFTGDPSFEFEYFASKPNVELAQEEAPEEVAMLLKEEERLVAVIDQINDDARTVPRGAYVYTPDGLVFENRQFEGLNLRESLQLSSYLHFRPAELLPEKSLLAKANMDKAIDFMDPLEEDVPKGSWSIQVERGSALVVLRSLLWLGYVFYQVPATRRYGSVYFGTGESNIDLPFMF